MSVGHILQHFANYVLSNEVDGNIVNFQCCVYWHLDYHDVFFYILYPRWLWFLLCLS